MVKRVHCHAAGIALAGCIVAGYGCGAAQDRGPGQVGQPGRCHARAWVDTGRCSAGIPDLKPGEVCAFGESPQVQDQLVGEQLATRAVNEKLGRFGGGQVVVGYDASTKTWRLAKGAELLTSAQGSVHIASLKTPPVGAQGAGTIESLRELGQVDASSQLTACFQVRVAGAEMYERCWDGSHYYRLERARVQLAPTDCTSSADGT